MFLCGLAGFVWNQWETIFKMILNKNLVSRLVLDYIYIFLSKNTKGLLTVKYSNQLLNAIIPKFVYSAVSLHNSILSFVNLVFLFIQSFLSLHMFRDPNNFHYSLVWIFSSSVCVF